MKRKRTRYQQIIAAGMTGILLLSNLGVTSMAAAPQVTVDETMYVNLDYYGNEKAVNIVKGCSTNGVTSYTDYGAYDEVVNMSDHTVPVLGDQTVSWKFDGGNKRFYYQCTMPEGSTVLPWDFDVSYRLNGAPADASVLAGASGLVEIQIKALPNKKTQIYHQNNMMLTLAVPVDMETCYRVEAPEAQLQSVGNNTVAMFVALPGEEGDWSVRIGTNGFESAGILMMMAPGTAGAFSHIKDIKEAKDTWRTDGDAMYNSMDEVLKTMETMEPGISATKEGLQSLEQARKTVNDNRKEVEVLSGQALLDLHSMTEQTAVLISHLDTAMQAVTDINNHVNTLSTHMGDMQEELNLLYDRMFSLNKAVDQLSDKIKAGITPEEQNIIESMIMEKTKAMEETLNALEGLIASGADTVNLSEEELNELMEQIKEVESVDYIPDLDVIGTTGYPEAVSGLLGQVKTSLGDGTDVIQGVRLGIQKINAICTDAGNAGHETARTLTALGEVTDQLDQMLSTSRALIDATNSYVPSMLNALGDTKLLMGHLTDALTSTHALLNRINQTLVAAGDSLDEGTRKSLNGIDALLEQSLSMLDATASVRIAGTGMKGTIDEQLNKMEEENLFLNIDPEASLISFTSEKNPSPHTSQIIVRTDEISMDSDDGMEDTDLEQNGGEEMTPFARMWHVIVEIFRSIGTIFKNR